MHLLRLPVALGAMAVFALAGAPVASADTLTYNGTTVTIVLTGSPSYTEIGATSPGGTPQYKITKPGGFAALAPGCSGVAPNYTCSPAPAKTVIQGTGGVDTVIGLTNSFGTPSTYNPAIEMHLGGGDDIAQAGDGTDTIDAGDGRDSVTNFLGNDQIDGGPDADELTGGRDSDSLLGGAGRDVLRGKAGADSFVGGADSDTVTYDERTAAVAVSLDGAPNDGESGEGDNVGSDVETILTGTGADQVKGDAGSTTIATGAGNDVVDPGGGPDLVATDQGDDTVVTRDGASDSIDCGEGADSLTGEELDIQQGCETLFMDTRGPQLTLSLKGKPKAGKAIKVSVVADEGATLSATATAKAGKKKVDFKGASGEVSASGSTNLKLKLAKRAAKLLAKAGKAKASLTIVATDSAGNQTTETLPLKLR